MGYRGPGIKMARGKWLIPHAILLLQVARLMARPPARAHAAPGTSVKSEIVVKVKQGAFSTKKNVNCVNVPTSSPIWVKLYPYYYIPYRYG